MRIAINVLEEDESRIAEVDIEDALAAWIGAVDFDITEQAEGCFTADTEERLTPDGTSAERLANIIERDTGAPVTVEFIEGLE